MGQLLNKLKVLALLLTLTFSTVSLAEQHQEASSEAEGEFRPGELISHHIADAHDWHLFSKDGHHYSIPLPVILYSADRGIEVFSSSVFHENEVYNGYRLEHNHIVPEEAGRKVYDFSITKNVAALFLSAIILLIVFFSVAKAYNTNRGKAPSGMQSFFEPIILFIRDLAQSNIGPKYERYLPYLLTVFFFIWFNNLLGLFPGGANLTGNIAVTFFLALVTFLITTFSGNKYYWQHIFNTPGVPLLLKPIIIPIEIVGMFVKPFSLMVRLFANITAGHIIILSLLGLIFIFKHVAASLISIPFAVVMTFLELFVAILQAYIFTLLSAMYIGSAIEDHSHSDHGH